LHLHTEKNVVKKGKSVQRPVWKCALLMDVKMVNATKPVKRPAKKAAIKIAQKANAAVVKHKH